MKIISLTAENVKRLKAVHITPDGTVQVIAGRNGQGKTSVLDSIWFALGGGAAQKGTSKPIRDGQDEARVQLDLGDLLVTRTWEGDKTTLRVESRDGARYGSPQKMLDDLIGRLSFDPLAFSQLDARKQVEELLALVELPFDPDELDARRRGIYEDRTAIGRDGKRLEAALAAVPNDPDAPTVVVAIADILAEHRAARQQIDANEAVRVDAYRARQVAAEAASEVVRLTDLLDSARAEADRTNLQALGLQAEQDRLIDPDLDAIDQKVAALEMDNERARQQLERASLAEQVKETRLRYDHATSALADIDQEKRAGLAAAHFPVEGLGFDDSGVTYQGIPFGQCSAAERLRVSLAMAMALNPRLRVIRILDGSLLDSDNMALIERMATENDYQVWCERVDESGSVGVVIEDGEVVSVNGKPSV